MFWGELPTQALVCTRSSQPRGVRFLAWGLPQSGFPGQESCTIFWVGNWGWGSWVGRKSAEHIFSGTADTGWLAPQLPLKLRRLAPRAKGVGASDTHSNTDRHPAAHWPREESITQCPWEKITSEKCAVSEKKYILWKQEVLSLSALEDQRNCLNPERRAALKAPGDPCVCSGSAVSENDTDSSWVGRKRTGHSRERRNRAQCPSCYHLPSRTSSPAQLSTASTAGSVAMIPTHPGSATKVTSTG